MSDDDSSVDSLLGRENDMPPAAATTNNSTVAATPAAATQHGRRRRRDQELSSSSSSSSPAIPPTPAVPNTPAIPPTPSTGNSSSSHPSSGMTPNNRNDENHNNNLSSPATPLTPLSLDGEEQQQQQQSEHGGASPASAASSLQQPPRNANNNNNNNDDNDEEPLFGQGETAHIRGTNVHVPTAAAAFTDFLRTFVSLRHSQRRQERENRNNRNNDNNNDDDDDDDDSLDSELSLMDDESSSRRPLYLSRLQSLLTHGILPQYSRRGQRQQHATSSIGETAATASLDIDTMHLYYHSQECQHFYNHLVAYPMEIVPLMDIIVQRELERLANTAAMQQQQNNDDPTAAAMMQPPLLSIPRVQVRPYNLRQVSNLRCLDPVSMDSLLSIKGMIVRASPIIPDLKVAHFACCICGHVLLVTLDRGRIAEPRQACPTCSTKASFQLLHCRSLYADKQMVRLQETPDEVPAGQTPASVVTFCFDDLVDAFSPGDKVEVTGVLRAQPVRVHPKLSKVKAIYKTYIDVIHFRIITGMETRDKDNNNNDNPDSATATTTKVHALQSQQQWSEERIAELKNLSQQPDIYDKLTMSLAPSIWELDDVKKGILAMLFGGNYVRVKRRASSSAAARRRQQQDRRQGRANGDDDDHDNNDESSRNSWLDQEDDDDEDHGDDDGGATGTASSSTVKLQKRGDINILLCGDPGTSKSQLLSYVNKLSTRGVYTSGKGSSAVGLTASVVRDPETRDLVLESGALVLSDLGICCIDEFDKMTDTTRSVLHEAMEQQTVSIAKAGIIATLHARTSVLASANPTESRYNPSMSVVDNIQLPPTLLSRFDLIYLILDSPKVDQDRRLAQHLVGLYYETPNVVKPPLDQRLLRDYIEYARENIHPEISDEASDQLVSSYLEMRNPSGSGSAAMGSNGTRTISATTRQLESLIRLSEALAKMRYSNLVTRADAREAVRLMKVATQTAATDPRTGRIDMDMIATGRGAAAREMEEQLSTSLKELFAERRGTRMTVRDVSRQVSEVLNTTIPHDDLVEAIRLMEADGIVQFNERGQSVFVRTGIVR